MTRPILSKFTFAFIGPVAMAMAASSFGQNSSKLVPLPNSVLPVVSKSMPALSLKPTSSIEVAISLKPQDPTGLQAFADAVSDPNSPMYGKFISPEEVGSRFGASTKDVFAAKAFLTSGGLTITHVGKNNMTVVGTGTPAQVEALFGTKIGSLQVTDETGTVSYRSNLTPLNVPVNLVSKIQSINGVETYSRPKPRTTALTPPLARNLYGLLPLFTGGFKGQGRTVAVSNWDGFALSNGNLYISQYNLPVPAGGAMSNVTVIPVGGSGSQNTTANGEGDLDFQMELGAAPLANIIIYDGTNDNLTTVLSTEASDNKADVISESYGWNIDANTAAACHNTHLAMTAQGITYCVASGDHGTDFGPFDYPDYDPEILSVGGTDATTDGTGNRTNEQTWGLSGGWGGGGGWCQGTAGSDGSPFNSLPSWQRGNGVPTKINKRLVPDVSEHATDWLIYIGGAINDIGGTSAASPAFAGGLTVVEQRLFAATGKARLGRVANKIYALNGKQGAFFDITTGSSIGTLPNGSDAVPTAGWDFATGWGAPNFNKLYSALTTSIVLTPILAQGVTPVAGTVVSGTKASLTEVDSNFFTMQSVSVKGLGQVGGFNAVYQSPFTSTGTLRMLLAVNGPKGASAIVSLQNVNTGAYDQFLTMGMTGTQQTQTVDFTPAQIAAYVRSNGTISLIIREVLPTRAGSTPAPFTFTVDKAAFAGAASN